MALVRASPANFDPTERQIMDRLLTIMRLLPAIIAAVRAIEEAIPQAGKGAEKLQAVREIMEAVDDSARSLWPHVAAAIAVLVGLFNKTGVFQRQE
jgi:hypothetical protein